MGVFETSMFSDEGIILLTYIFSINLNLLSFSKTLESVILKIFIFFNLSNSISIFFFSSSDNPLICIVFKLNLSWKFSKNLKLNIELKKIKKKDKELIYIYLLIDASLIISSRSCMKVIFLYLAISGTRESEVIPGWVFNSNK